MGEPSQNSAYSEPDGSREHDDLLPGPALVPRLEVYPARDETVPRYHYPSLHVRARRGDLHARRDPHATTTLRPVGDAPAVTCPRPPVLSGVNPSHPHRPDILFHRFMPLTLTLLCFADSQTLSS